MHRHPGAGDRRGARAAIGLQHIAVDLDGSLTQSIEVDDRAQAATDQTLDFLGATRLLATRGLAIIAGIGGPRQHAVFGGHPALALAAQKRRHFFFDARGAQHPRITKFDQHRALGMAGESAGQTDGTQGILGAAARALGCGGQCIEQSGHAGPP